MWLSSLAWNWRRGKKTVLALDPVSFEHPGSLAAPLEQAGYAIELHRTMACQTLHWSGLKCWGYRSRA